MNAVYNRGKNFDFYDEAALFCHIVTFFQKATTVYGLSQQGITTLQQLTCEQHCCRRATFIFCTLCILYIAQQCYAIKLYLAQFRTCPRGIKSQQWHKGLSRLNSNLCIFCLYFILLKQINLRVLVVGMVHFINLYRVILEVSWGLEGSLPKSIEN